MFATLQSCQCDLRVSWEPQKAPPSHCKNHECGFSGHIPLLTKYYDVMVRCDHELWTIGMSFPFTKADKESLELFACNDGEGVGIEITVPKETRGKEKRLIAEIHFYLDYYQKAYRLNLGAPALPWERAEDDDERVWIPAKPRNHAKMPSYIKKWSGLISKEI